MNCPNTRSFSRLLGLLLTTVLAGLTTGCGGCGTPPPGSPGPMTSYQASCTLHGRDVAPTPDTTAATRIDGIDYQVDPTTRRLTYTPLINRTQQGKIVHHVYADGLVRPTLVADSTYTLGEVQAARQTSRYKAVPGQVLIETTTTAGDATAVLSWAIRPDASVPYARLRVRDDDATPGPGVQRRADGTYRVLPLYEDGVAVSTPEAVHTFLTAAGFDLAPEAPLSVLTRVSLDPALHTHMNASVGRCGAPEGDEDGLRVGAPAESAAAATCGEGSNPLGDVLTVSSGLMTLFDVNIGVPGLPATPSVAGKFGAGGLGLGMAIGVSLGVTTGAGALAAVGAGIAISYGIGMVVDSVVQNNFDTIVNTGGDILLGRDEGRSAAISEFYGNGGGSSGDPHLTTFDGERFDFHGSGEFVLARVTTGPTFEVHTRQNPTDGACPSVAFNHGMALAVDTHRFELHGTQSDGHAEESGVLYIDGLPVDLVEGDALVLDNANLAGGTHIAVGPHALSITGSTGDSVYIRHGAFVHVLFDVHRSTEGLLGNNNGTRGDDFGLPTGTGARFEYLHGAFAERWRATADTTLFAHVGATAPDDFERAAFPGMPATVDTLDADDRAAATTRCTEAGVTLEPTLSDCIVDVACAPAAPAILDELLAVHRVRRGGQSANVLQPLSLAGWVQTGPTENGTWTVSDDARSVVQEANGGPTFFVSPQDYLGVRLEGTLEPSPADDDIVGFAFGYQAPLDGPADTYDTFVLSWKGAAQDGAPEGMRLLHVHGSTVDGVDPVFWDSSATDVVTILASDTGDNTGWTDKPVRFSLLYTANTIAVSIDGEERLRVAAADSPVPFNPGRFGFYNYSQPNTAYADFAVGPPSATPHRTDCTLTYRSNRAVRIEGPTTWGGGCTRIEVERSPSVIGGGHLDILPGTTVAFAENIALQTDATSAFSAVGTADAPIILEGTAPNKGHWGGVAIQSDRAENQLAWVTVRDTGAPGFQFTDVALTVTGPSTSAAQLGMQHVTLENASGAGLHVWPGGTLSAFAHNTFAAIDGQTVRVPMDMVATLGTSSTFAGAGPHAAIHVARQTDLTASATWPTQDAPYAFSPGSYSIEGETTVLTLSPGSTLLFDDSYLDIADGALNAQGSAEAPIVFDSVSGMPGGWGGITVRSDHAENVLAHTRIDHAGGPGYNFVTAALLIVGETAMATPGGITVRESTIANSADIGVRVDSGGRFTASDVTYTSNTGEDLVQN